jgi:signal transduction histidine kinase
MSIINESERLSQLSANVLNLTKLDNQSILTGISRFNVSEQIRHTVILLENKWSAKNIDITFDSDDYSIFANSELLSQLWINLLDNAIKFSPAKTEIKIAVSQNGSDLIFTFSDQGKGMDENTASHTYILPSVHFTAVIFWPARSKEYTSFSVSRMPPASINLFATVSHSCPGPYFG